MPPALIPADMAVSSKFAAFNLVDIYYKTISGVSVPATILVPKDIAEGEHPVLVRWHGGSLITGHRMYPEWFGGWILELAISKSAIIVSPDYRLMPEANGLDILQDVRDLFAWLLSPDNLSASLPEGISGDVDNILVTGESAGGWLALQSALLAESRPQICAVISLYPMIDFRDAHYTGKHEKHMFRPEAPKLDRHILRDYISNMKTGAVITSAVPPDRVPLVISFYQQGAYRRFFGTDNILFPLEAIDSVSEPPPTWVIHGTDDSVIPVEGSYKYEQHVRDKVPNAKLHVHYEEGADHGFDNDLSINLNTPWIKEGLKFIDKYWP